MKRSATESLKALDELAQETSSEKQQELMHRITDLFLLTEDRRQDRDTDLFGLALDKIAYSLESDARQELAERLSDVEKAPKMLIYKLASDDISVAKPILEKSPCLSPDDLSAIIEQKSTDHRLAICNRDDICTQVTDALIEHGDENVLCKMAENQGANFSKEGLKALSERASNHDLLRDRLIDRADLPQAYIENIKERSKYDDKDKGPEIVSVDPKKRNKNDPKDKGPEIVTISAPSRSDPKRTLTEFALTGHARARRLAETVNTLSKLTGITPQMASHCLFSADLAALGVLCKANKFERDTFGALLHLRILHQKLTPTIMQEALQRYDVLNYAKALKIMDILEERLKKESINAVIPE